MQKADSKIQTLLQQDMCGGLSLVLCYERYAPLKRGAASDQGNLLMDAS